MAARGCVATSGVSAGIAAGVWACNKDQTHRSRRLVACAPVARVLDRQPDPPRGGSPALVALARTALVRHWPLLLLLALGLALRVAAWLAVRPAWWILGDGIGYLDDAMNFQPDRWRPSGYSLLVLRPLLPLHHLSLITVVQHGMGLATALLVSVSLLRLGLPRWAAALAAVPVLFDGYVVATEQMVASEALFGFLVVAGLAALLWRVRDPGHVAVALTGLLLAAAALTRVVGLPLIAVAALALLVPRPRWSRLAVLAVAFALPVGLYANWFSHTYGQRNLTASSGIFLYGRTTNFVDCGRVNFSSEQLRRLCPPEPVGARNEVWYDFDAGSPLAKTGLGDAAANDLAGQFAREAILAQPGDYAALTWNGVVKSFQWDQSSLPNDMLFLNGQVLPDQARATGVAYQGGDPGPFVRPELARALTRYQGIAHVPGTLTLFALLLAVVGLVFGRDPDGRGLRAALLATAGAAAALVLVPALTAIVAPRYLVPAVAPLSLAVTISGALLANRWRVARRAADERRSAGRLETARR